MKSQGPVIISHSVADPNRIIELQKDSRFRKATRNMMLAFDALERSLEDITLNKDLKIGLVVTSGYGELDATYDFLVSDGVHDRKKPISFQNSLHNSTLGFLTRIFHLTGPGYTVSNRYFSGEDAVLLAMDEVNSGLTDLMIVIGVEGRVKPLDEALEKMYPESWNFSEGAGCILLSTSEIASSLAPMGVPQVELQSVQCHITSSSEKSTEAYFQNPSGKYYDADFIELLALNLSGEEPTSKLRCLKPNNTYSEANLTYASR